MERATASSRVSAVARRALFPLLPGLVLSGCGANGEAPEPRTGTAAAAPREARAEEARPDRAKQLMAAIDDAIRTLDAEDYPRFVEHYYPVEELRMHRRLGNVDRLTAYVEKRDDFKRGLLQALRAARQHKPRFNESKTIATFEFDVPGQEDHITARIVKEPPDPRQLELVGYGPDLDVVIEKAIATLERGDVATFIDRLFPASELALLHERKERQALADRIGANPAAVKQMIADLKAIKKQKAILKESDDVAIALIERGTVEIGDTVGTKRKLDLPSQRFKFQKVNGSWRLFDEGARAREELARLSKLTPKEFKLTMTLVFERFGDAWRIAELPESLESLE